MNVATLKAALTSGGISLWDVQNDKKTLLVFLRHLGCTYCREAIADIAENKASLDATGTQVVFIHMSSSERFEAYVSEIGLTGTLNISDTKKNLYLAFELKRGSPVELLGPKVLARAILQGALLKHGVGFPEGDSTQMPGAFLVHKGEILKSFVYQSIADKPDYCELASTK